MLPVDARHLRPLCRLIEGLSGQVLLTGNSIKPLVNGEQVYPEMLAAIDSAKACIILSTYQFDRDLLGREFIDALGRAVARGVFVRVLIDGLGALLHWPTVESDLHKVGVIARMFSPVFDALRLKPVRFRNHRKILVVDGAVGFTGGINIIDRHFLLEGHSKPIQDTHFKLGGPIVSQMSEVFASDWLDTTGERLPDNIQRAQVCLNGEHSARGIATDAANAHLEGILCEAISLARQSLSILTPYFVPSEKIIEKLIAVSGKGVRIEIILPSKNFIPIEWASRQILDRLRYSGCSIYYSFLPFDHSKLFIMDNVWCLFGSANWDPRSLKYNHEFNVECYSSTLATELNAIIVQKKSMAHSPGMEAQSPGGLRKKLEESLVRLVWSWL